MTVDFSFENRTKVVCPSGHIGRIVTTKRERALLESGSITNVQVKGTDGLYREFHVEELQAYIEPEPEPEPEHIDPTPGTIWRHHSGREYKVELLANQATTRPEQYPVTVVYKNTENGSVWSRPLSEWHRSFSPTTEPLSQKDYCEQGVCPACHSNDIQPMPENLMYEDPGHAAMPYKCHECSSEWIELLNTTGYCNLERKE